MNTTSTCVHVVTHSFLLLRARQLLTHTHTYLDRHERSSREVVDDPVVLVLPPDGLLQAFDLIRVIFTQGHLQISGPKPAARSSTCVKSHLFVE